jgi:membrane associated rhomboid family serine protease
LAGLIALSRETPSGGVAWFAHIGGFLVGLVSARALSLPRDADTRAPSDRRAI